MSKYSLLNVRDVLLRGDPLHKDAQVSIIRVSGICSEGRILAVIS